MYYFCYFAQRAEMPYDINKPASISSFDFLYRFLFYYITQGHIIVINKQQVQNQSIVYQSIS